MKILLFGSLIAASLMQISSPASAPMKQYVARVNRARVEYYKNLSSIRREILQELKSRERRLAKAGNVDGAADLRKLSEQIAKQILTPDDLIRWLNGKKYLWGSTRLYYHFTFRNGKLIGWLDKNAPSQLTVMDCRILREANGSAEWMFSTDGKVFLWTDGKSHRVGVLAP